MEIQNIIGEGVPDYPQVRVPVEISLAPLERGAPQIKLCSLTLLQLTGELHVGHVRIGQFQETLTLYANANFPKHPSTRTVNIHVPLDLFRIGRIEEGRKGDLTLHLWLSLLIAVHTEGGQVDGFTNNSCDLSVSMPQSHWITKVLPGLGYGKLELVEIAIPETALPETFSKAMQELQHAKQAFVEGSYGESVGKCRNIVQLIVESKRLKMPEGEAPSFPKKVDVFVEQQLGQALADSKRQVLGSLLKTLWTFSSIAHHSISPDYFTRGDAELCIRSAAALLAYSGRLLK
jgi:hypothetical protein